MTPRRQRIVYTNHTGKVSGAEKVLLSMLRGLDQTRYEPYVICPAEENLQGMLEVEGIPCATVPTLHARYTWRPRELLHYLSSFARLILATRKEIERCDPDFVHANTVRAGIAATVSTMGTRRIIIWHVHDDLPQHPLSKVIRLLAHSSKRTQIVAVSKATAKSFCGALSFKGRMHVIPNGTDLGRFPLKRPGESRLKNELGIPEWSFLVCAVGQICARKGLRALLEAFSQIYDDAPSIHLAIVGRPVFSHEEQYRDELVETAVAAGISDRVHFTGERQDISSVFRSADLLVLNSLEEPFGLVLVEAMSSGTPVLATRVGGIPEIVTDSKSGWLIERDDTTGLASKLLELSKAPGLLGEVTRYAHDEVSSRFSLERFLSNLHAFYAELAKLPCANQEIERPVLLTELRNEQGDQHV
jgi:glycosyltransferase involved in cell wall biosynthesis